MRSTSTAPMPRSKRPGVVGVPGIPAIPCTCAPLGAASLSSSAGAALRPGVVITPMPPVAESAVSVGTLAAMTASGTGDGAVRAGTKATGQVRVA